MMAPQASVRKRPDTERLHVLAVHKVISQIRENLGSNIRLDQMAALACMSPCHFNRTFRRVTGLSPRRYLGALRFEAAIKKLRETDHSILDICMDVGYSSLGTFVRRFSDTLGIPPRRFRVLRKSPVNNLLDTAALHKTSSTDKTDTQHTVKGWINAPSYFLGPIFVGLFPTAIPEGMPVACAITLRSGSYSITAAPPGRFYLFALGLALPSRIDDYFNYDSALRGGGDLVIVNDSTVEVRSITLRPPSPLDPPILLNLPKILETS